MSIYSKKAVELFTNGCNCSQAVFLAFNDKMNLDENTAMRISSSFGGGMGKLAEVCGTVSGMFMVLGVLCGYSDVTKPELKSEHYKRIRELAKKFKDEKGAIVCRELLGIEKEKGNVEIVNGHRKSCYELVALAANLTENMINELSQK